MLNLILFGPPGSGKGTQATKLAEQFGLIHISTGDLFRYEIGNDTPLGREAKRYMDLGQLCPDTVTIGMLRAKVERHPEAGGFIFDGFPRTVAQAQALDRLLKGMKEQVDVLVALDVEEDEITSRLLERGKNSGRSDDQDEAVIRKRFAVYLEETAPVYQHYLELGKAVRVDGVGGIEDIFGRLTAEIEPHKQLS
ncbi:MAG: adenylate kinase [Saprospiraceae bacterium]